MNGCSHDRSAWLEGLFQALLFVLAVATVAGLSLEKTFNEAKPRNQQPVAAALEAADSIYRAGLRDFHDRNLLSAETKFQQSLSMVQRLAPNSPLEIEILHRLALVMRDNGQQKLSASLLIKAINLIEDSQRPIETLSDNHIAKIYRDTVDVIAEASYATGKAFATLERSHTRRLYDASSNRDMPHKLSRTLREELDNNAKHNDRLHDQLMFFRSRRDQIRGNALSRRLERLHKERRDLLSGADHEAPRLTQLTHPRPLDLDDAQALLESGEVMLSYSVGEARTHLFAMSSEAFERYTISISEEELRSSTDKYRQWLSDPRAYDHELFLQHARELYDRLVAPAEHLIDRGQRLLIVPDGPLHLLPFNTLVRTLPRAGNGTESWQYLIEWRPLRSVLSATLYSQLKKRRPSATERKKNRIHLTAFGDPVFVRPAGTSDLAGGFSARGSLGTNPFQWQPMPSTRREVQEIAGLFDKDEVRIYLGSEATEKQAKSVGRGTRILHFATHAYFDERLPASSGLVLSTPEDTNAGSNNGLLQAWEIAEHIDLDADLVVLSACQSALGKAQEGHGFLGLAQAFQVAGARSVIASLWNVADEPTADLMVRFYKKLSAGHPPDRALQLAQIDSIRQTVTLAAGDHEDQKTELSAPYYWAAFQLIGDSEQSSGGSVFRSSQSEE